MTYEKKLCSICCLAYNHYPFIENCIKAIWDNDYKQIEIIVVDDGSNDKSVEKLKELQKISSCPFTLIEQKNTGFVGKNFNNAAHKAKGEFILFMAIDDMLYPHAISEKINLMIKDPNIAFIANASITTIDDNNNITGKIITPINLKKITPKDLLELETNKLGSFYIQGTIFRKDIFDTINGFDNDIIGDDIILRTKFFLYLQKNTNYTYKIFKDPACYYRIHTNNIHKNKLRQIQIISEYYDKYWPNKNFPPDFLEWVFLTIKNEPYEKAIEMFTYSNQMKELQSTKFIQDALKSKKRFEHKKFYDYIFRIEDYGIRKKIIIFHFIKITISK